MAILISRTNGNFAGAASTWEVAEAGSGAEQSATSAYTTTTESYVYSSTFTGTNAKVITGVALFLYATDAQGTFSVTLSDDAGVTATREVTVDVADLPGLTSDYASWVFFKFGSTLTLDGGTDYRIGVKSSVAGTVSVGRNATASNWTRILATTTTSTPAITDRFLIVGELTGQGTGSSFTVTMNSIATTSYGAGGVTTTSPTTLNTQGFTGMDIGWRGTLDWETAVSKAYNITLNGNVNVWAGGAYKMGTVSAPCPRSSTMTLNLPNTTDGGFGFLAHGDAVVTMQGLSRTEGKDVWVCRLNTDEAATSTVLGVDTDTGWLSGDEIVVSSTGTDMSNHELRTLSINADATTLTIGSGLTYAHSGTAPNQAYVTLLTRNVRIVSASSTLCTYAYFGPLTSVDIDWVEFKWIGKSSAPQGITSQSKQFDMRYSSLNTSETVGLVLSSANTSANTTFKQNVVYKSTLAFYKMDMSNNCVFEDCVLIGNVGTTSVGMQITGSAQSTFSNNTVLNFHTGLRFNSTSGAVMVANTMRFHNCGNVAINVETSGVLTFNDLDVQRIGAVGTNQMGLNASNTSTTHGSVVYLNNVVFNGCSTAAINAGFRTLVEVNGGKFTRDSNTSGSNGIIWGGRDMRLFNCEFSNTLHFETADINIPLFSPLVPPGNLLLGNTVLHSANQFFSVDNLSDYIQIQTMRHGGVAGDHRTWKKTGIVQTDSSIFYNAAPSERLTPNNATTKLESSTRLIPVNNNSTVSVQVYVRKSEAADGAAYNGSQPRLVLKKNPAIGVNADSVLDTVSAANGTWEALTGTSPTVTDHGVLEMVIDCDGTAGWVNVDDWTITG